MVDRLLSIDEVAVQFNVSASTVRRWVRSGKLVGQKAGAQWRFDPTVVREAFQRGALSGASGLSTIQERINQYHGLPEWAKAVLARWRKFLEDHLRQLQPDHVIVNDRRGAKVWKLIMPTPYVWGKNLWHSTAVKLMTPTELRQIFGHRRVLLFDEMMQHGREIHELRQRLEAKDVNANVTSVVCIRRRSYAESEELLEYKAFFCENLDDSQFVERAALISRLSYFFEPPLDVDHLLVKGTYISGLKTEDLLERAARWGVPFVVWFPDKEHESMAITLDRPQFFETRNSDLPSGFSFGWNGPAKIRIYGTPEDGLCYCSFIIYPDIEAPESEWARFPVALGRPTKSSGKLNDSELRLPRIDETTFQRVYSDICINLAVKLLGDFIKSGAAEEIGIHLDNTRDAIDVDQLQATFGPTRGAEIAKQVRGILTGAVQSKSLFSQVTLDRLPLFIRGRSLNEENSCDIFNCRVELLKAIPSKDGANRTPISLSSLLDKLPQFSESTIGRVFDDDLDTGAAKPLVWVDHFSLNGSKIVKAWRGFCRGEFGPWFEWERLGVVGHKDLVIQRTIGLGPTVVENFLKRTGETHMTATQLNKTFSNLQHDLREGVHDLFYLGWRPYKFGPVPIVEATSRGSEYMEFQRFLVDVGCLDEKLEKHGSQIWRRYKAADDTKVPWRNLYKARTNSTTRAYIAGLVRLYAAIENQCTTLRPSVPRSSVMSIFQDPLVVLSATRNTKVAYICGWFEISDWREKGELLFSLLDGVALTDILTTEAFLKQQLEDFAEPARLLFDKIEMYRNLPYLRKQIENLLNQGDFDVGEVLLDSVDESPKFELPSEWPMYNLEWACKIMRAFSSFTRQILTICGLDVDERTELEKFDDNKTLKDASYYLNELLSSCPELKALEDDLRICLVSSSKGHLTKETSKVFSQTFRLISSLFDNPQRIPDPRSEQDRNRERWQDQVDVQTTLLEIPLIQPYAIAVSDIKNLRNLPRIADIFGGSYVYAMNHLLEWVKEVARDVVRHHEGIHFAGTPADNVILAGCNPNDLMVCVIDLVRETTRRLGEIDRDQLALFGLLRSGITWRDEDMGKEFQGVRPGKIAHDLANQSGQDLGAINITKAVLDRLLPEHQNKFTETTQELGQGKIFVHHQRPDKGLT